MLKRHRAWLFSKSPLPETRGSMHPSLRRCHRPSTKHISYTYNNLKSIICIKVESTEKKKNAIRNIR